MTLTVRLDSELEKQLAAVCKRQRVTKSRIVSALVRDFIARHPQKSSYQVASEIGLVGCVKDGPRDLAANAKKYLKKAIRAKHSG